MRSLGRAVCPGAGIVVVTLMAAFAFRGTLSDADPARGLARIRPAPPPDEPHEGAPR
jgi:hypothetical protein